jgi:hypothetical protein
VVVADENVLDSGSDVPGDDLQQQARRACGGQRGFVPRGVQQILGIIGTGADQHHLLGNSLLAGKIQGISSILASDIRIFH